MTREKARQIIAIWVEWLAECKYPDRKRGYIEGNYDEEDVEAFRVAMEALSAEAVQVVHYCKHYDVLCAGANDGWNCSTTCPQMPPEMKRKEQLMAKYISYETFMELSPEHRKRVYELMIEIDKANNSLIEAYRSGYTLLKDQNEILKRTIEKKKAHRPGLDIVFEEDR